MAGIVNILVISYAEYVALHLLELNLINLVRLFLCFCVFDTKVSLEYTIFLISPSTLIVRFFVKNSFIFVHESMPIGYVSSVIIYSLACVSGVTLLELFLKKQMGKVLVLFKVLIVIQKLLKKCETIDIKF